MVQSFCAPDLPDAEWKFGSIPAVERGVCFFWETLREIERPSGKTPSTIIAAGCARSAAFHRFNQFENHGPLKLLAWLNVNGQWPNKPWFKLKESERKAIRAIEIIPAIVNASSWSSLRKKRYEEAINREIDLLYFPFTYEVDSESRNPRGDLMNFLGLSRHEFVINRLQYDKEALLAAFSEWLDSSLPPRPGSLSRVGRVEPAAWLWYLSGFRLLRAASSNGDKLLQWKPLFNSERDKDKQSLLTIPKAAKNFVERFQELMHDEIHLKDASFVPKSGRIK